jgi:hypothetical protein
MKHLTEPAPIFAAEISRQCLGQSITDSVWMAGALAFDDFHVMRATNRDRTTLGISI